MVYDNEYKERAYQWWISQKSCISEGEKLDVTAVEMILDVSWWDILPEFKARYEIEQDSLEKIRLEAHHPTVDTSAWALDLIDRTVKVMERDK